jgi:hypothetical protein
MPVTGKRETGTHNHNSREQTLRIIPGWSAKVELGGTLLEDKVCAPVKKHDTEVSWLECKVEEDKFIGYGEPCDYPI